MGEYGRGLAWSRVRVWGNMEDGWLGVGGEYRGGYGRGLVQGEGYLHMTQARRK